MSRVEDNRATELLHVRGRWDYVKKKLKRRGVVEVNKVHPHHDMLCAIQTAIRKLLTEHPEAEAKVSHHLHVFFWGGGGKGGGGGGWGGGGGI